MSEHLPELQALMALCAKTPLNSGVSGLEAALEQLLKESRVKWVLTRGNWHRLGGIIDSDLNRVADNLAEWVESQCDDDPDELLAIYADSHYLVTRISGKTHYFTLPVGDQPEQFIQIEIEELQEVIDRPLVMDDWYPETIEDLIDPVDFDRLDPQPVGLPRYEFRRVTAVAELPQRMNTLNRTTQNLRRFFEDWGRSSAGENALFCHHWVLAIREYQDSDHSARVTARPLSTFSGALPQLPLDGDLKGSELANAIHSYDRKFGYSFAWYFNLLRRTGENYELAKAVLRDQMGAYDYLPAKDVKVLRAWEERPYSV